MCITSMSQIVALSPPPSLPLAFLKLALHLHLATGMIVFPFVLVKERLSLWSFNCLLTLIFFFLYPPISKHEMDWPVVLQNSPSQAFSSTSKQQLVSVKVFFETKLSLGLGRGGRWRQGMMEEVFIIDLTVTFSFFSAHLPNCCKRTSCFTIRSFQCMDLK